jgi:hypothetical protein
MIDRRTLRIKRDTLFLHPHVRLIPCGMDNAGKLDMVAGTKRENFLSQGSM